MLFIRIAVLCTVAASAVMAQSWAQPVREADREAKSAIVGTCGPLRVFASHRTSGMQTCTMRPVVGGGAAVDRVPGGKVLVIEELATVCTKLSSDSFSMLMFGPTGALKTFVPTYIGAAEFGRQNYSLNQLTKMYVGPTEQIYGYASTVNNANGEVSCNIRFQGHLVDVQ